jgi:hypothetical protein
MVIIPPGPGELLYRPSAYVASILAFTVGSITGAGVIGGLCGMIGTWVVAGRPALVWPLSALLVAFAVAYGLGELFGSALPVPTSHWQVPRHWEAYGRPAFALAFGVLLGAGFITVVPFIGYYLLLGRCALAANPVWGAAIMSFFGATRALPLLIAPLIARVQGRPYTFDRAVTLNGWLGRTNRRLKWLRAAALLATAGVLITGGLRP